MFESVVGHKNARNESMSVDTDQIAMEEDKLLQIPLLPTLNL